MADTLHEAKVKAEELFAACLYIAEGGVKQECNFLAPSDISTEWIRALWQGVLDGKGVVEAAGNNITNLVALSSGVASYTMGKEFAQDISLRAYLSRVRDTAARVVQSANENDVIGTGKWIEALGGMPVGGNSYSLTSEQSIDNFIEILGNLDGRSVKTHIQPLDMATGGLENTALMILAARPGMGKTALAFQVAMNVAMSGGRALFFSLEMSQASLWARVACGRAGVRWRDLRAGRCSQDDVLKVQREAQTLKSQVKNGLYINDRKNTTGSIAYETNHVKPDIVLIDHLVHIGDEHPSDVTRLGNITSSLKLYAKEFDIPVVCLHQINRGVESREDKRPLLSDLRDSGKIEENADDVLFMYRDGYYTKDKSPRQKTEINIAKFRGDMAGQEVFLEFNMPMQHFGRLER